MFDRRKIGSLVSTTIRIWLTKCFAITSTYKRLLFISETKVAHWWAKVYDEGSEYGINGGRISKLTIKIDGVTTLCYDRGWDIEPDENDYTTMVAYSIILQEYN